ncbi:MAG: trigger factor [Gemmatimonadetes bacterium]|nr:trigger factor [Gemmatimonadota bacterium]
MAAKSSELSIAVDKPRTWARRLTITVPGERVERERQQAAQRLAQRIKLPGFRKGKVPTHVLERKYGAALEHEALERVLDATYREALAREGLQPITQAALDNVDYHAGSDLSFQVEFEIRPEIALQRLGGFRVKRERAPVSEADVEIVLERLRRDQAVWRPLDEEAPQSGDLVGFEVASTGAATGGTVAKPRPYQTVLGEGRVLPEIEAAVSSLRPGEAGEFTLPAAQAGGAEAQGAARPVRIRLIEAKRPELPPLDDELARSVGEFDTVAALREHIRLELEREADAEAERGVRRHLIEHILEANPVEVPNMMVDQYLKRIIRPREGADPERVAEMHQVARPGAEHALKRMLVIERVAEQQALRPGAEEVEARVEELARRGGRPAAEVKVQLRKTGQLAALEEELLEDKVFEFLKAQSTIE